MSHYAEPVLNENEREIALFLKTHDISHMTANDIARRLFVGRTMIYRVVKKMGYATFTEYKYARLQKKSAPQQSVQINAEQLFSSISLKEAKTIVRQLVNAQHVFVLATAATSIASQYFSRQLANLGLFSIWVTDQHEFEERKRLLQPADVVFCISNSGENGAINPLLKDISPTLIAITKSGSSLDGMADLSIPFNFEDYRYENSFDRENIFPIFVIMQQLLIMLKHQTSDSDDKAR